MFLCIVVDGVGEFNLQKSHDSIVHPAPVIALPGGSPWNCIQCTMSNRSEFPRCEACHTPRSLDTDTQVVRNVPRIVVRPIVADETEGVESHNLVEHTDPVGRGDRRQSGVSAKRISELPAVISELPVATSVVRDTRKRRRRRKTIEQIDDDSSTSVSSRSPSPPASKLPKPSSASSAVTGVRFVCPNCSREFANCLALSGHKGTCLSTRSSIRTSSSDPEWHLDCTIPGNSCLSRPFRRLIGSKFMLPGCFFIKSTSSLCLACTRQARAKRIPGVEIHYKLEDITEVDLKMDAFDAKKVEEWMALMRTYIFPDTVC
jgi:hypothetical protein